MGRASSERWKLARWFRRRFRSDVKLSPSRRWTSADAAGLPILPGLLNYDEVASGAIHHAIRFTAPQTRDAYVWPARHDGVSLTGLQYPPMGQRFRLKADFDISSYSPTNQVILQALKTYGMILADNGSSWYSTASPTTAGTTTTYTNLARSPARRSKPSMFRR